MSPRAKVSYAALTDVGRVRTHNEDSVLAQAPLFVVADGLGGHQAGEIASSIAIETLRDNAPRKADSKALGRAVRAANKEIMRAAKEGYGRSGMGTTVTAALVEGTRIAIAHVGDSRAYLLHAGVLERVSQDHSMVADMIRAGQLTEAEARIHPNRSVITRALGTDPNVVADTYDIDAEPGDRLLLCSDGLSGMLIDSEIARILGEYREPSVAARALIDAANEAGGHDNISAVIVDIEGQARGRAAGETEATRRGWVGVVAWLLIAALVIGGALLGGYRYAYARAFAVSENGVVVLYRGVPGEFAGVKLSWPLETTDIPVDDLPPAVKSRLAAGIELGSPEAARELAEEYRRMLPSTEPSGSLPGTVPETPLPGSLPATTQ